MPTKGEFDVIVIGGGVIGCAVARDLSKDHTVLVVEKDQIAGSTTGKASGIINVSAMYSDYPTIASYTTDFFREYDGTGQFEFTERPGLCLLGREEDENAGRERVKALDDKALSVNFLDEAALDERFPDVFHLRNLHGAIEYSDAGWLDPYTYTITLKEEAENRGAEFKTNTRVDEIRTRRGTVQGVETATGPIKASWVVCAAGWQSRHLVESVRLPLRPFRYQTVNLEGVEAIDDQYPICWYPQKELYWRPEHNGDLHVGGRTYFVDDPGYLRTGVTEEFLRDVAGELPTVLTNLSDAEIASTDTCPIGDAATPDKRPIIDTPSGGPAGLVIATGFHGLGIQTSPMAARIVRSIIDGSDSPFPDNQFRYDRFESDDGQFDYESLTHSKDELDGYRVD